VHVDTDVDRHCRSPSRAWNLSPGASCYRAELGRGPGLYRVRRASSQPRRPGVPDEGRRARTGLDPQKSSTAQAWCALLVVICAAWDGAGGDDRVVDLRWVGALHGRPPDVMRRDGAPRQLAFDAPARGQSEVVNVGSSRRVVTGPAGRHVGLPGPRTMSSARLHSLTGQLVRAVEEARMAVPQVASRQRWLGARLALLAGEKQLGGAGRCPGTPGTTAASGSRRISRFRSCTATTGPSRDRLATDDRASCLASADSFATAVSSSTLDSSSSGVLRG
jgi:hypothetical protein